FRHVPIVLSQFRQQECALRRILEFLERAALEQRAERAAFRCPLPDETLDVGGRNARPRRENQNALTVLRSSRTLPGQSYVASRSIASDVNVRGAMPCCLDRSAVKCATRS